MGARLPQHFGPLVHDDRLDLRAPEIDSARAGGVLAGLTAQQYPPAPRVLGSSGRGVARRMAHLVGEAALVRAQPALAPPRPAQPPRGRGRLLHPVSDRGRGARGTGLRRLEIGDGTLLEPGCWLTLSGEARIRIGEGCFLNRNTMLAAVGLIEIGDHVMFANNCFVGDSDHRYDDPTKPVTWQGFEPQGPVADRLQLLVRGRLRRHRRCRDRRAVRDRRELGGHPRTSPPG